MLADLSLTRQLQPHQSPPIRQTRKTKDKAPITLSITLTLTTAHRYSLCEAKPLFGPLAFASFHPLRSPRFVSPTAVLVGLTAQSLGNLADLARMSRPRNVFSTRPIPVDVSSS